jgi:hypothetical protein
MKEGIHDAATPLLVDDDCPFTLYADGGVWVI